MNYDTKKKFIKYEIKIGKLKEENQAMKECLNRVQSQLTSFVKEWTSKIDQFVEKESAKTIHNYFDSFSITINSDIE